MLTANVDEGARMTITIGQEATSAVNDRQKATMTDLYCQ